MLKTISNVMEYESENFTQDLCHHVIFDVI